MTESKGLHHIPKIIHQSYSRSGLKQELSQNISHIKSLNPGWDYRFYDDGDCEEFIKNNFESHILKAYNKINPVYSAARADLFRYLLIFKTGGVWLDIKSSLTEPLDHVLKTDDYFLLSQWQNRMGEAFTGWGLYPELRWLPGGEFQQWHIVSAPENPFLKAVIKRVVDNIYQYNVKNYGVGKMGVLRTTGPIAYSSIIAPLLKQHPHRFVDICRDLGFEYTIYDKVLDHEDAFDSHYSKFKEPVVIPS